MTIFIKTWINDLDWLQFCLRSIAKYAPSFNVVIVADNNCKKIINGWGLTREKVVYVNPTFDGYLYQQLVKLRAFDYTDDEYILFIDSDCIFTDNVDKDFFIKDGKIDLLMTPYEDIPEVMFWKEITDKAILYDVEFEFMRRNGLAYHRNTLIDLWGKYSHNFFNLLKTAKNRQFSEFNLIGAYAYKYDQEKYNFINTRDNIPYHPIRQFWSWGGITKEVTSEVNKYL